MTQLTASKGARGGAVTLLGQAAKLVIQLVSVIVLSRLLSPSDFGLVAMAMVFAALGDVLRDFGMPTAALQARELTRAQASNLFWINTGLGVVVAALMLLATPWIVLLYSEPRLAEILPLIALTLVVGSVSAQFQVHLARSMRFITNTATDVAAQMVGLAVAVLSALLGAGYWALAWQTFSIAASLLALRVVAARWLPARPRRRVGTKSLFVSGSNFGLAYLLTYVANNVDTVLIGAQFDAGSVGYYNRSFQLLTVPLRSILSPLTNVVVPTVNRLRAEGRTVDSSLVRIQSIVGIVVVLAFAASAASAEYLVPLMLGDQWHRSILIFQILAAGGAFWVFSNVSFWGFILHDKSRQLLYYNLVSKTLAILLVAAGSMISLEATAIGYSIGLIISWPINLIWLSRSAGQRSSVYWWNGMRIVLAGTLAFLASRPLVELVGGFGVFWATTALVTLSSLVFIGVMCALPGGLREVRAAVAIARTLRPRSS